MIESDCGEEGLDWKSSKVKRKGRREERRKEREGTVNEPGSPKCG